MVYHKKLFNELNVPIGLIHSSWGGSPAESWASLSALKTINPFEDFEICYLKRLKHLAFHEWGIKRTLFT